MAKSWEILNNDDNDVPEIKLMTDGNNADAFVLRNIFRGIYGRPKVIDGIVNNGLSAQITLSFDPEDNNFQKLSETFLAQEFSLKATNVGERTFRKNYLDLERYEHDVVEEEIDADYGVFEAALWLESNYDTIKDYDPKFYIRRHRSKKMNRSQANDTSKNKPAGFVKSKKYITEIPITSSKQRIILDAAKYFDIFKNDNTDDKLRARGTKTKGRNEAYQNLMVGISLTDEGKTIHLPMKVLTLSANYNGQSLYLSYIMK